MEALSLSWLCSRLLTLRGHRAKLDLGSTGAAAPLISATSTSCKLSVLLRLQVSITFDPFLYLPVPLPQKQKVLTVYYFAKEPHKKPIKVKDTIYSG